MPLSAKEIREKFLSYFEKNGHKRMRSSSLIPIDDPTLLFINAGMNQFKEIFTGKVLPATPRATTVQKCMRVSGKHNDLNNVGRTARHHTFFEMLGNFSFGDYFKEDAIKFAWGLITEELNFDQEKLWITVYKDDDEAFDIWTKQIGFPEDRVVRLGDKDNFWSMGETGPCGPCSEIHFDQGDGPDGIWKDEDIYGDSDRFLEIWNLVFMQFERHADGSTTPLPKPSVDTGGGLERFAAILQGVQSNYETDLFIPIINKIASLCGKKYHDNIEDDTSLQIIADHVRATTFLIGDGMLPSNLHRGYVLRRIMRRAIRHGNRLGFDKVFMPEICDLVISQMGDVFPELTRNKDFILNVVTEEEKGFRRTLNTGLEILNTEIERLNESGDKQVSGEMAFKLYDTYGFPVDLTEIIAKEQGKGVDFKGFDKAMTEQKERGRASWKGSGQDETAKLYSEILEGIGEQQRYPDSYDDAISYQEEVAAIIAGGRLLDEAPEGVDVEVFFKKTRFYAESGGQIGDHGLICSNEPPANSIDEALLKAKTGETPEFAGDNCMVVLDSLKVVGGLFVHKGRVLKGSIKVGDKYWQRIDDTRRKQIRSNHSATHLLQYALMKSVGSHVKQSGSWVGPDRLRFDFTHFSAIEPGQVDEIEQLVSKKVIENIEVGVVEKSLEQAQADGAIAFFGEKYGDVVRVVSMSDDSVELCGGSHVQRTGDIGTFKIIHESSIASGIRRIEALTGLAALEHIQSEATALREAASMLSLSPAQVPDGVKSMFEQQKADKKRIDQLQKEKAALESNSLMDSVEEINGIKVLCTKLIDVDPKALRDYGQQVLDKLGSGIILLALETGPKANLLIGVTEEYRKQIPAGKTISVVSKAAGGKGGGRPDMAQAGGADPEKIETAFETLKNIVKEL